MSLQTAIEAIEEMAVLAKDTGAFDTPEQLAVYIGHSTMVALIYAHRIGRNDVVAELVAAYDQSPWAPPPFEVTAEFAERAARGELTDDDKAGMRALVPRPKH